MIQKQIEWPAIWEQLCRKSFVSKLDPKEQVIYDAMNDWLLETFRKRTQKSGQGLLAERIANAVFTNGSRQAAHRVLLFDANGLSLSEWSHSALRASIEQILITPLE